MNLAATRRTEEKESFSLPLVLQGQDPDLDAKVACGTGLCLIWICIFVRGATLNAIANASG